MSAVVVLAGNPNSGKTTLFNALTGSAAKVANYPGVTVESREASMPLPGGVPARLLDVPGAYSLSARTAEEQVAIAVIAGLPPQRPPDLVLVVVDSTQLARNLYLLLQVLELGGRIVVALNLHDVLARHRLAVDAAELQRRLGVPVVPISASRREGLDALRAAVAAALAAPTPTRALDIPVAVGSPVDLALDRVAPAVPDAWCGGAPARRRALAAWALLSLQGGGEEHGSAPPALRAAVAAARAASEADLDLQLIAARYAWIDAAMPALLKAPASLLRRTSDAVDRVLIHPVLGFAIFLLVMTLVFQGLFAWSQPAIDAVDGAFGALAEVLAEALPAGLLSGFVTGGLVAGVGSVLVFLPQILLLFLFISIMEDSGYMARVAFLMDRVMKAVGLTGRAFVPMLSGFACAIPAIMATRTMERRRDRMLTMMVVPIMTCSARLPVYTLIIAALYPGPGEPGGRLAPGLSLQAGLMVAMYLFSTVVALLAAAVLGRTLFRGGVAPLVLELPPYRLPQPRSVLTMVWERARLFVSEAGTVILGCTVVLWLLLSFPREAAADLGAEGPPVAATDADARAAAQLRASYAGRLGRLIEPAIAPLGFDWKIGIGLIGAFAAREVFVSTMGVVYGMGQDADEESLSLRSQLQAETWPDGRKVYTPLVGLSLMVFFALAAQCMSTLAVVRRETASWRWPVFLFGYMTVLAWGASFLVFQGGRLLGYA